MIPIFITDIVGGRARLVIAFVDSYGSESLERKFYLITGPPQLSQESIQVRIQKWIGVGYVRSFGSEVLEIPVFSELVSERTFITLFIIT